MLPEFTEDGDLPPGVYRVTLAEALTRFGRGSPQRQLVAARLSRIHTLAASTGSLRRFVAFGSFVTAKREPNDVDIILIMEDGFDTDAVNGETAIVFQHAPAQAWLGASVFWTCARGAFGGEQAMIEYWQIKRGGGQRGIVEIIAEQSQ